MSNYDELSHWYYYMLHQCVIFLLNTFDNLLLAAIRNRLSEVESKQVYQPPVIWPGIRWSLVEFLVSYDFVCCHTFQHYSGEEFWQLMHFKFCRRPCNKSLAVAFCFVSRKFAVTSVITCHRYYLLCLSESEGFMEQSVVSWTILRTEFSRDFDKNWAGKLFYSYTV